MGFISSGDSITIKAYLTQKGRELYYLGDDSEIITKYFALGDSDANYFVSASPNLITEDPNTLESGFIPDLTGDQENCIKSISGGLDLKYKITTSPFGAGVVINQYCQPPHTLVQEISNGDGTSHFISTPNSISCGFYYSNPVLTQSFTKNDCSGGGVGQSYLVTVPAGQFTATTQTEANQLAMDYLLLSGQTIANQNGTCLFGNTQAIATFIKNDCPNGGNPYTVVVHPNTLFSNVSQQDADNLAYAYLTTNGQSIANQNGTCKQIVGYNEIILVNTFTPNYLRTTITNDIKYTVNSNNSSGVNSSSNNSSLGNDVLFTFNLPLNLYGKNIKLRLSGTRHINSGGVPETILFNQIGYLNNGVLEVLPDATLISNSGNNFILESNYDKQINNNANDVFVFRIQNNLLTGQSYTYTFNLVILQEIPIYG